MPLGFEQTGGDYGGPFPKHEWLVDPELDAIYDELRRRTEMCAVMRPQPDWFIGQRIREIRRDGDAHEWSIVFDSGATINNEWKDRYVSDDVIGAALQTVILSELDCHLVLSNGMRVTFTPAHMSISLPGQQGQEEPHYPFRPDPEEDFARMGTQEPEDFEQARAREGLGGSQEPSEGQGESETP